MPTPDQLFTLEEVSTQVTQPVTQISAQSPLNTTARNQQLRQSVTAFGNALANVAEYSKRKRIAEDINIAKEAAVRNEIMPGGLLPVAQQAFRDTQDIDTANKILSEAKLFKNSEEAKAIVENQTFNSKQKNDNLGVKFDSFFDTGVSSIQNPASLQKLKLGIETLKFESMEDVLLIEQSQKFGTALSAINGNINAGFEQQEIDPSEIFTSKWLQTNVTNLRTALPWVSNDDAKLAMFNLLANNEEMLSHPDIMAQIIQGEFSKGVTFSALMHSRRTAAGKEVFGIYQNYLQKVKQNYDDLDRAEVKAQKYLNDEAVSKGIEYLENIEEDDPNYADRFSVLRQIMREQTGSDFETYNKLVTVYEKQENTVKNNEFTDEFRDGKILISSRSIKTGGDLLEYVVRNNLNSDAYSRLNVFLRGANTQYTKNVNTLKERTATVNNGLITALKLKIQPNSKMMNIIESASADQIKASGISMKDLFGRISVDPDKLVNSLIALAEERDKLKIAIDNEADLALYEDREVDSDKISNQFNQAAKTFIEDLNEIIKPDEEREKELYEPDEIDPEDDPEDQAIDAAFKADEEEQKIADAGTIGPDTGYPLPNYKLFELTDTSLIGSEKKIAEFINDTWNTLMLPMRAAEKLGKDAGTAFKEDVTKVFELDKKAIMEDGSVEKFAESLDLIKDHVKKKGDVPEQVAAAVAPFFSIFGGTEAEAAEINKTDEQTESPILAKEIVVKAPKPIKAGTKERKKKFGGMVGETGSIVQTVRKDLRPEVESSFKKINESDDFKSNIQLLENHPSGQPFTKKDNEIVGGFGINLGTYNDMFPNNKKTIGQSLNSSEENAFINKFKIKINEAIDDLNFNFTTNERKALQLVLWNSGLGLFKGKAPQATKAIKEGNKEEFVKQIFSKKHGYNTKSPGAYKRKAIEHLIFKQGSL